VPYADKNGLYTNKDWKLCEPAIRKYWLPYMQGHGQMKDAVAQIVGAVLQ
jgi:hypothetical protein